MGKAEQIAATIVERMLGDGSIAYIDNDGADVVGMLKTGEHFQFVVRVKDELPKENRQQE
jgi:hypothetical protein